jgi:hypothetical protein
MAADVLLIISKDEIERARLETALCLRILSCIARLSATDE